MDNLKELSLKELSNLSGGIVWVPIVIKGIKFVGAVVGTYMVYETTDGIVRGVAGGEYLPEACR